MEGEKRGKSKTITLFLATSPYTFENSYFAIRLAEAALEAGHHVNLFASGDGVYNFTQGHKARGVPNAEAEFKPLMDKGLRVELCGTCLAFRGIKREQTAPGATPSSLESLSHLLKDSDIFITLGF